MFFKIKIPYLDILKSVSPLYLALTLQVLVEEVSLYYAHISI